MNERELSVHAEDAGYGVPPGTTRFILSFLYATATTSICIVAHARPNQIKSLQFSPMKNQKETSRVDFFSFAFKCVSLLSVFIEIQIFNGQRTNGMKQTIRISDFYSREKKF